MQALREARRFRVLVVDDDPLVLELVTTRLDLAGYQTLQARDGFEAMERLKGATPSAMILDINMPGLDGFGVLRSIGQSGLLARIPTMVLTARNQPADVQKAISLGASDFLAKPFKDELLLARVARLLRRPQAPSQTMTPEGRLVSAQR